MTDDGVAGYRDMWPHLVVLGDDGRLASNGLYEMDQGSVSTLIFLFQEHTVDWERRRLAVFAGGGYRSTADAIAALAPLRDRLLEAGIYPVFIIWETEWFDDLEHEVRTNTERLIAELDVQAKSPETRDVIAKMAVSRSAAPPIWDKIQERSELACRLKDGGARYLAKAVDFKFGQRHFDLHLVSHGAGDLLLAEFAKLLTTPVSSATVIGSASRLNALYETYLPMLDDGRLQHLCVVNREQNDEQSDTFGSLDGSLLDLVATVLDVDLGDRAAAVEIDGDDWNWTPARQPLIGLQRDLVGDKRLEALTHSDAVDVETLTGAPHLDIPFLDSVEQALVARMLAHRTDSWQPKSDRAPAPALPLDPLERAEFLSR